MSTETGRKAETVATHWLESRGFRTISRNWRTRWCELDVVAEHNNVIHIVEVKYRRRPDFGSGFEAITRDKSHRLQRAAVMWIERYRPQSQYQIDVVSVTGFPEPNHVDYLPNAIGGD